MPNPDITTNEGTLANANKKLVFLGQIFFGLLSLVNFLFLSVSHGHTVVFKHFKLLHIFAEVKNKEISTITITKLTCLY